MDHKSEYLIELLKRYEANFDITENFKLQDKTYPAYAWFYSLSEKYVLKKEAQLWAMKAYEHVFFIKEEALDLKKLDEINEVITNAAEPVLVRRGENYPEKDHMCSYITFIVITDKDPDEKTIKAIKKYSFDKGYMFNLRGHSEARIAVISMDFGKIYTNRRGKELKDILGDVYLTKSNKLVS